MRWVAPLLIAVVAAVQASAATIQTRLIRASNQTSATDPQLKELSAKLREQFGYQNYRQLGAQTGALKGKTAQQLNLGEGFAVTVTPKSAEKKVHEIALEWTSGKASLVKSTVKIAQGTHLFIKGPEVGNDWIILSLSVKE